jgi:type VI secretion system protein ImpE
VQILAERTLREGNPKEALASLQEQIRKEPASAKHRIFLFQLLATLGDWERAQTQLNVVGELDHGALAMVQMYREALHCEVFRSDVFSGKRSPVIFGEPEQWMALLIEALKLSSAGQYEQAMAQRQQAFDSAPATPGNINGEDFEWIADADSRLGPMLEAIINGRYYWVPFSNIHKITFDEPEDLRDLVWMPAYFTWLNGGESVGLIPTRYSESELSENNQILMAGLTEWVELSEGNYQGLGQRLFTTDQKDYPIMDTREILLGSAADNQNDG